MHGELITFESTMVKQRVMSLLVALVLCTCMLQAVTPSKNQKSVTCPEESRNLSCMFFVADGVEEKCSNIAIWIESKEVKLDREVVFINCSNLSILSKEAVDIKCITKVCGFKFENVTGLLIKNLNIHSCQSMFRNKSTAALQVYNSKDVEFENIHFSESRATAAVFINTYGTVQMINCSFSDNELFNTSRVSYPGGVYIEFTSSKTETMYTLSDCFFVRNKAPLQFTDFSRRKLVPEGEWSGLGLGGGLGIMFTRSSKNICVSILNCNFTDNSARWGGGLYIHYQGNATNNTVFIDNTYFNSNIAENEGGGINVGFLTASMSHNQLKVTSCTFYNNTAAAGGGMSLFAVHAKIYTPPGKSVTFQNCTWLKNVGKVVGSAVVIAPSHFDRLSQGFLPVSVFENCTFSENVLYIWKSALHLPAVTTIQYSGVFTITKAAVVFQELTVFNNNNFTALHITSGQVFFEQQSKAMFHNNYGIKGAAIAMYGFSALIFANEVSFDFTNNSATCVGGAIYYETFDQNDFNFGRKCFLQYNGPEMAVDERHVHFAFEGNTADTGTSIYSTTFFPCFYEFFDKYGDLEIQEFFQNLGTFVFDNDNKSLATNGRHFELAKNYHEKLGTVPGKVVSVPLKFVDEFKQAQNTAYAFSVEPNEGIENNPKYSVNTSASFYGTPYEDFTFIVSTQKVLRISTVIQMSLLPCPPGFYYSNKSMSCECAADNSAYAFVGMTRCNNTGFYAYIQEGYWGGYLNDSFYTALCPLTFCAVIKSHSSDPSPLHALPNSSAELNKVMCGKNRKGILCGDCQQNNSVYYHSRHFKCKQNHLCKVGFLFYILSEIIPTVILFTVIITFNISFTSGNMNGFILFSQVLETISLNMRLSHEKIEQTTLFFNIFYGILNLDFFNFDTLSFCLWEGATVMDILAFKYVTVVFALFLVIALMVLMNLRICTKFRKKMNAKLSIIHGISAFLVICYYQCTKISFYILTGVALRGEGSKSGPAVTFFGGIPYFEGKHKHYVFPAMFCLVTITIIPPVLLFIYPLLYQLLSLCGLSEHYIVTKLSNAIAIHKMMPIFDSFQSCYKDKLRFFAGLYFMYRVAILALYTASKSVFQFHTAVGFLFFIIRTLHSLMNPYKKNMYNRIDLLLFLNLELINVLTLISIVYATESTDKLNHLNRFAVLTITSTILMVLTALPITLFAFRLLFLTTRNCFNYFRKRCAGNNVCDTNSENNDFDDILFNRGLDEDEKNLYFKLAEQ